MTQIAQYLSTTQAAQELGITPVRVRQFCQQGRLGVKVGERYLILLDDLRRFQQIDRKTGQKIGKRSGTPLA